MTESEWLACTDLYTMLEFLRYRVSDRKLRFFACACSRRIWPLLAQREYQEAVETGERYADGQATEEQIQEARGRAHDVYWDCWKGGSRRLPPEEMISHPQKYIVVYAAITNEGLRNWSFLTAREWVRSSAPDVEPAQCGILREVVGNPFRPVALNRVWRTPTVTALATAAYDDRILPAGHLDPDQLAILADALEDAGCDNADMLDHCRSAGPHVRGCWVVDLVLSKS